MIKKEFSIWFDAALLFEELRKQGVNYPYLDAVKLFQFYQNNKVVSNLIGTKKHFLRFITKSLEYKERDGTIDYFCTIPQTNAAKVDYFLQDIRRFLDVMNRDTAAKKILFKRPYLDITHYLKQAKENGKTSLLNAFCAFVVVDKQAYKKAQNKELTTLFRTWHNIKETRQIEKKVPNLEDFDVFINDFAAVQNIDFFKKYDVDRLYYLEQAKRKINYQKDCITVYYVAVNFALCDYEREAIKTNFHFTIKKN